MGRSTTNEISFYFLRFKRLRRTFCDQALLEEIRRVSWWRR